MIRVTRLEDGAPVAVVTCDFCGKRAERLGWGHESDVEVAEMLIAVSLFRHVPLGRQACNVRCGLALRERTVVFASVVRTPPRGVA